MATDSVMGAAAAGGSDMGAAAVGGSGTLKTPRFVFRARPGVDAVRFRPLVTVVSNASVTGFFDTLLPRDGVSDCVGVDGVPEAPHLDTSPEIRLTTVSIPPYCKILSCTPGTLLHTGQPGVSAASSSKARTFAYVQAECAHVAHLPQKCP